MPGGMNRNRNVDRENGARAETGRSSQVCCRANRKILREFRLGAGLRYRNPPDSSVSNPTRMLSGLRSPGGVARWEVLGAPTLQELIAQRTPAMASGLFSAAFLAPGCGSIALTGMPGPPSLRGCLTSRAAVTSLWRSRQEPAFTVFEQAPAAARMPTAKADWLTRRQARGHSNRPTGGLAPERSGGGKVVLPAATLRRRHGRRSSRDRQDTHARLLAATQTCEGMQRHGLRQGQCRHRRIAEWLSWLCDNGSVLRRC